MPCADFLKSQGDTHKILMVELEGYIRSATDLFASGLSTCPVHIFQQRSGCKAIDGNAKEGARIAYTRLSQHDKGVFLRKAAQNARVRKVIGAEHLFNEKAFFDFAYMKLPLKARDIRVFRSLTAYIGLRKAFLHESNVNLFTQNPIVMQNNLPVFDKDVDLMLEECSLKIKKCRSFSDIFLIRALQSNAFIRNAIHLSTNEKCILHELVRISFHVRKTVGAIQRRKSTKDVFYMYKRALVRSSDLGCIAFMNVIQAHAFFENYATYLNAIRTWQLARVKAAICG